MKYAIYEIQIQPQNKNDDEFYNFLRPDMI